MEGEIADDHRTIQRLEHGIGKLDARAADTCAQVIDTLRIDVDRAQVSSQSSEVVGEGAIAGADLEDRSVGGSGERREPSEGRAMGEEVLAEFVSATGMGSRSQGALQS